MFDLLIKNGRVLDGSGNPWVMADVAAKGGRIAAVGLLGDAASETVVDASGLIVCPGFVDGHSHSDLYVLTARNPGEKDHAGVHHGKSWGWTGCPSPPYPTRRSPGGRSTSPASPETLESHGTGTAWATTWTPWTRLGPRSTSARTSGSDAIRLNVIGMEDRAPSAAEMEQMRRLTAEAMEQGAPGVSAGLIYPPSQYQSIEEIVELCRVASRYGGIFDVHMRNESDRIAASIEEVLEIGRRADIPVLITHFKVRGKRNWGLSGALLERLERARADGVDVTVSRIPPTRLARPFCTP